MGNLVLVLFYEVVFWSCWMLRYYLQNPEAVNLQKGWWSNPLIGNILTLVGICVTMLTAIVGVAFHIGRKLSRIETILEVSLPAINKRLDRLEDGDETSVITERRKKS